MIISQLLNLSENFHLQAVQYDKVVWRLFCEQNPKIYLQSILIMLLEQQFIKLNHRRTMLHQHTIRVQKNSAFKVIDPPEQSSWGVITPNCQFADQLMKVITAQNLLIIKMLERQNALQSQIGNLATSSDSGQGGQGQFYSQPVHSTYREYNNLEQIESSSNYRSSVNITKNRVKIIQRPSVDIFEPNNTKKGKIYHQVVNQKHEQSQFLEDFDEQEEDEENTFTKNKRSSERRRQTETKNMVKNFSKSIFSFIRKNRGYVNEVLKSLSISQGDFMSVFDSFKGRIHSISQLRALWTPQGNPCHKAFRILSSNYLRKRCLERTFNSRVENFNLHLKYRQRLLECIENPDKFYSLKTS